MGRLLATRRGSSFTSWPPSSGLHELAVEDALEPHQRPKLDQLRRRTCSCPATPCGVDADGGRSTRRRSTRSSTSAGSSPSARTTASRWIRCSSGGTDRPTSPRTASASCSTACSTSIVDGYFDTVQAFDDYYDEVSEGIFADRPLDPGAAAPLVRDAPGAGAVPPARRARCARRSAG